MDSMKELVAAALEWQETPGTTRNIRIDITPYSPTVSKCVFVYDYDIGYGTYVKTLEELDKLNLKELKKEHTRKELELSETIPFGENII